MDFSADISGILASVGESVTLADSRVVKAYPTVASSVDTLGGDSVTANRTRVLTMSSADVPFLESGQTLTWRGQAWGIVRVELAAAGNLTRAFLGAP